MQSLTASTPCEPRNGMAFRSICESFVNYCNLLLQFIDEKYCVWKLPQDERYCYNCSLCNFGLDCRNNPIHYSDTEDDEE